MILGEVPFEFYNSYRINLMSIRILLVSSSTCYLCAFVTERLPVEICSLIVTSYVFYKLLLKDCTIKFLVSIISYLLTRGDLSNRCRFK